MELQHIHTFRVTMTRSQRTESAYAHTSIRTKTTFKSNLPVSARLSTDRDECMQLKAHTYKTNSTQNTHTAERQEGAKSQAAKLIEDTGWQREKHF